MKKKITVIALVACLLTILVGTSLAYFMDTDEATNTFTVGSVEIEQKEVFDTENAQLLPVVNTENVKADVNFREKIVAVENTGKNSAYVQTLVAVPKPLIEAGILHIYDTEGLANSWVKEEAVAEFTKDSIVYTVIRYRYMPILEKEKTTTSAIQGVYIDSATDLDVVNENTAYFVMGGSQVTGFNAMGELNVYVASQAVQADGFADADAALSAAFTTHPWA